MFSAQCTTTGCLKLPLTLWPRARVKVRPRPPRTVAVAQPARSSTIPTSTTSPRFTVPEAELLGLFAMARPHNVLPSFLLVLAGAWAAGGRTVLALGHVGVWIVGSISASIAVASCIVNDIFDFESGSDAVNAPQKPLPSGTVPLEHAIAAGAGLYILVLLINSVMSEFRLRLVVAASATLTLLYTPVLKRMGLLKNATVAAVIAAAPFAGALAAAPAGLHVVIKPCMYLFLGVTFREILMDINDGVGDAASGVRTLPVMLGKGRAVTVALAALSGAATLLVYAACQGDGLVWIWASNPEAECVVRVVASLLGLGIVAQPFTAAARLWKGDFDKEEVSQIVNGSSRTALGLGTILAAVLS